jgi:hypothetical protein
MAARCEVDEASDGGDTMHNWWMPSRLERFLFVHRPDPIAAE